MRGLALLGLVAAMAVNGPNREMLVRPNNFTLDSWYHLDYRERKNPVRAVFAALPASPFWQRLASLPPGSVRLAVGGRALPSFTQTDARWQTLHRQQVWNAQLAGYCAATPVLGEAAPDSGIRLDNVVSLADPEALRLAEMDYLVFNLGPQSSEVVKVLSLFIGHGLSAEEGRAVAEMRAPIRPCIERFAREHGAAAYEDEDVVVFALKPGANR
jgi:hypothetical protein